MLKLDGFLDCCWLFLLNKLVFLCSLSILHVYSTWFTSSIGMENDDTLALLHFNTFSGGCFNLSLEFGLYTLAS